MKPFIEVLEVEQVAVEDPLVLLVPEARAAQPQRMPVAPRVLPASSGPAVAQKQRAQSMAVSDQSPWRVLSGAAQAAGRRRERDATTEQSGTGG
jgi:hypothetical protein